MWEKRCSWPRKGLCLIFCAIRSRVGYRVFTRIYFPIFRFYFFSLQFLQLVQHDDFVIGIAIALSRGEVNDALGAGMLTRDLVWDFCPFLFAVPITDRRAHAHCAHFIIFVSPCNWSTRPATRRARLFREWTKNPISCGEFKIERCTLFYVYIRNVEIHVWPNLRFHYCRHFHFFLFFILNRFFWIFFFQSTVSRRQTH